MSKAAKPNPENEKISIFKYVAYNSPAKANMVLSQFGERGASTRKQVYEGLVKIVNEHKEDALEKIMEIHPDRQIFEDIFSNKNKATDKNADGDLNACGCGVGADGGNSYMNCEGNPNCDCHKNKKETSQPVSASASMSADGEAKAETKLPVVQPHTFFTNQNIAIIATAVVVGIIINKVASN